MRIIHNLKQASLLSLPPCTLTIGVFDGIHLGHRYLFLHMKKHQLPLCVITFAQLPYNVLYPHKPIVPLISFEEKINLFKQCTIDYVLPIDFTLDFAQLSYLDFINLLQSHIPFSHLVLGDDALFGHDQKGTPKEIMALSQKKNFTVHYIPRLQYQNTFISSTAIRQALLKKDISLAEKMLGRKLSKDFFPLEKLDYPIQ